MRRVLYVISHPPYSSEIPLSAIGLAVSHKLEGGDGVDVALLFVGDGVYCPLGGQGVSGTLSIEDLLYTARSLGVSLYYVVEDAESRGHRGLLVELASPISEGGLERVIEEYDDVLVF